MNETRTIVGYLTRLDYRDLPPEVSEMAKLCILDTVGVGLFASRTPWASMVADFVSESRGRAESAIWGQSWRATAQYAALVNATAAHGIEMDDRNASLDIHNGSMTIPAAVATAERVQADGKRLITAVVAGYELAFRVARAVRGQAKRGFHPAASKGTWGSAAAASKLLNLDEEQMLNAFGLVGSMASGIIEFSRDPYGTMVKRFHGGWASQSGVTAALLGQKGLTGPRTVLEGEFGYCRVYAGDEPSHPEELTKDLGKAFQIMEREVKPYAAWGGSHSVIDAIRQLQAQHSFGPQEVERVSIGGSRKLIEHHDLREPQSIMAGQYSLPFLTAAAFFKDLRNPAVWTDELLRDPAILALAQRVDWHIDDEMEAISQATHSYAGAKVTIALKGGRELSTTTLHSKGTQANPVSPRELREKFDLLAGQILPARRVEQIAETILNLERIEDARQLGDLLMT